MLVGVDVGVDVVVWWASAAELTGSIAALEMIRGVAPLKMNVLPTALSIVKPLHSFMPTLSRPRFSGFAISFSALWYSLHLRGGEVRWWWVVVSGWGRCGGGW